ncbi:formate dehydrogenase accessory sulfurtransferase FdhD [Paenibacillus larvae]|uniref:Sulfur carrier protein FdhD n=1 Tax=Paenibacillus larvae TaxID=1464 RepID=A0AAP5JX51_9BACL|nr:formate dehydrogenase accessory sulfurtransferase FdhD [Paenibacillus larvae]MCY7475583.1 formate dehydrogenase accessory sulfurtransferase FdhD [Paenibacillus larvae]MCY7489338.1 formate dehydrogenase accessory sulfurtransferase FdhD [Paenibacillus larvae]MCY9562957.1 formate dehydrogenase accessory sulfurtransferase FdhD [Paenibacillus larvae]MCY9567872.1 formate dehydrogenase accessory sulfurtransferase FdhD [Paenibacillus larvae]MCY9570357.1 formate dehydrogenase accessory sulfurtransfe
MKSEPDWSHVGLPVQITRRILRVQGNEAEKTEDQIVTEYPLTLVLNDREFATLVCTPEHLEELVAGFLCSEGAISGFEDIDDLAIDENTGFAYIKAAQTRPFYEQFHSKRVISSCCGKSRQSFYFHNDRHTVKKIPESGLSIRVEECFRLMEQMQEAARTFRLTGGVHNAALCDRKGVLLFRMDIGRHNALDKIYGHCLMHQIPLHDKIMVFSGRLSSEVLLKTARIGCGIVLSKSAPTQLALDLAEELNITTVGFLRHHTFNIYTGLKRIELGHI